MDLKLLDAEPTALERAAIDHLLGPAPTRWEGGERSPGEEGHTARTGHDARSRRHLLLPALHALQEHAGWISPGGAQLRLQAARRAARRRLRRGDVLRAPRRRAAPAARRARVRGPRLPLPRIAGADRAARGARRAGGRGRRRRHLVPQPVPRPVRPGARRDAHDRGRGAERAGARAGRRPTRCSRSLAGDDPTGAGVPSHAPVRRPEPAPARDAWATCGRRASTTIARTAATPRFAGRSRSGPTACSARSRTRSCSAAAAPPSRPASSGRRWRGSLHGRTT